MDENLKALYRDTLLDHSRNPRNKGKLPEATATAALKNPLCGDLVSIQIAINSARIDAARFEAQCCSLCMASASLLTEAIQNQNVPAAQRLAQSLIRQLNEPDLEIDIEPFNALSGVKAFPSRIRCATLPWEALLNAFAHPKQS